MDVTISGRIQNGDEEITLVVEGEYVQYGSDPSDAYIKMRKTLLKKEKEEDK